MSACSFTVRARGSVLFCCEQVENVSPRASLVALGCSPTVSKQRATVVCHRIRHCVHTASVTPALSCERESNRQTQARPHVVISGCFFHGDDGQPSKGCSRIHSGSFELTDPHPASCHLFVFLFYFCRTERTCDATFHEAAQHSAASQHVYSSENV